MRKPRMRHGRSLGFAISATAVCSVLAGCAGVAPPGQALGSMTVEWVPQASPTTASLRGISAVDSRVAWASGTGGTFLRTVDGGATWRADTVPGATGLDFRDVHAVDASIAYLMSAGEGAQSRIYKTTDGGRSWTLQFTNLHPKGFFDGMAFRDAERGMAYSDPVDGRFLVIATSDGGRSWTELPRASLPPSLPGEAAFAASGTGIVVRGDTVWFGTGGGAIARVFRSTDRGRTWTAVPTPLAAGKASAGVFSVAFGDARNGVAVGGDYANPTVVEGNVARTTDGGVTWRRIGGAPPRGYRSGAAFVPGVRGLVVAVGTTGSDFSLDGGESWMPLDTAAYNAVSIAGADAGWTVGPEGRIAKLRAERQYD